MSRIPEAARGACHDELRAAKHAPVPDHRWVHLERAHILSQPDLWPHTRNHVAMLTLAVRQRDRREALGQILRIVVAAPGSLSGRYPDGNTGRATVGLRQPMPLPADLQALLRARVA